MKVRAFRKRALVTGGAGFLGSHLCERLLAGGCDVLCVDNYFIGVKDNTAHLFGNPNFEAMRHDVTFALYVEVDEIYNLACPASPIHYQDDPVQTTKSSVYGASKEAGERHVRENVAAHVILRTAWVYSPHGHNFVKTMLRLGSERDELGIVDDQRGCPTAAADIARAIVGIATQLAAGKKDGFGTFHFCGAGATTWYGFARANFELAAARGAKPLRVQPVTAAHYPTPAARRDFMRKWDANGKPS